MEIETLLNKQKIPPHSANLVERIIMAAMVSNILIFIPRPRITLPLLAFFGVFAGLYIAEMATDIGEFLTIDEDIL